MDSSGSSDQATSPFVCFVHGLESTPNGAKVIGMRAQGLQVMAPNMHMSLWNVRRKNSAVRSILRTPQLRTLAATGVASVALSAHLRTPWPVVGWGTLSTAWLMTRRRELSRRGLAASLEACLEIVARQIHAQRPDIIVGSSWGGAVCMELIRLGEIKTPTLLLAPAYRKIGEHIGWQDIELREAQIRERMKSMHVEIFHDTQDDVIPFEHSQALVEDTDITLHGVRAGGHALRGLITDGSLVSAIHDMHASATR